MEKYLPAGYIRLEYIQTSGTQYINTLFQSNQDSRALMVFDVPHIVNPDLYIPVFNGRTSHRVNDFSVAIRVLETRFHFTARYRTQERTASNDLFDGPITIELSKDGFFLDGAKKISFSTEVFQSKNNLLIGSVPSSPNFANGLKIYSFKLYDNNEIVRDYIPCKNRFGETGLYDLVNGQFYGNAGTGDFIRGPEITPSLTELFTQIADAIRGKDGTETLIPAREFPTRIIGISN